MQCPSCGALQEIGAEQGAICEPSSSVNEPPSKEPDVTETPPLELSVEQNHPSNSKLIEFPSKSRSPVPQWRKDLSERVRKVQERRAREAALEAAKEKTRESHPAANVAPQLELLHRADVAPVNPIVTAALRRIERAHRAAPVANRSPSTPGAALAYRIEDEYEPESLPELEIVEVDRLSGPESPKFDEISETGPVQSEKVHNLAVVPPAVAVSEHQSPRPKPRRLIVDNDPSLNYLDSIATSVPVEVVKYDQPPAFARLMGAVVDLTLIVLLCSPFAAVVELTSGNWRDIRVAVAGATVFSVMSFLYFTISTALTGRTAGLRLFSLRIVDARTGLIPTGKQSAGRALVYLGTILTLGLASLYVLIDRDKQTAHDRLARTTVITV